jgi:probable rRNA maturation factor
MASADKHAVVLEMTVEAGDWPAEDQLTNLCLGAIDAAHRLLLEEGRVPSTEAAPELSMLFTDDAAMADINGEWRGQPKPTNVLSFPATALDIGDRMPPMLGDIVFALETIQRETKELDRKFGDHLAHLTVHGYLHLLGYDHIEADEAEEMESLETRILAKIGISDPYESTDLS